MDDSWAITIPRETANDDFVILTQWLVNDGDHVDVGAPIALFETSKATVELVAPNEGYVFRQVNESAEVPIGAEVGRITSQTGDPAVRTSALEKGAQTATQAAVASSNFEEVSAVQPPAPTAGGENQRWSNKARALAAEHGLSTTHFRGKAMVREEDVQAVLRDLAARQASAEKDRAASLPTAQRASRSGRAPVERVVPLTALKRTEIRYLRTGNSEALVSTITVGVRARGLDRRITAATDRRLTYVSLVLPVVARTLRDYPELNSFLDDDGIHYYADVNVGVAINLGEGLFVPVLRQANTLDSDYVASAISSLIMKSVRGELREADLSGGTFTITDLTDAAALHVLPLLNRDQAAILGVGLDSDGAERRLMLSLAFDHRISDGLQAAQFLGAIKQQLEGMDLSAAPTGAPTCSNCRLSLRRLRQDGIAEYLMQVTKENGEQALLCPTCLLGLTS